MNIVHRVNFKQNKEKQDMHSYILLCNTTPNQQDLQNGIKKLLSEPINECAVRLYVFLSSWIGCVKTRLTYDNSAHLKAEATCLLKTCGKIFLDRQASKKIVAKHF